MHFVVDHFKSDTIDVFAGSVGYLMLTGYLLSAWQLSKALMVAEDKMAEDKPFYSAKIATARFHAEHLLPQALSLAQSVLEGGQAVNAFEVDQF